MYVRGQLYEAFMHDLIRLLDYPIILNKIIED